MRTPTDAQAQSLVAISPFARTAPVSSFSTLIQRLLSIEETMSMTGHRRSETYERIRKGIHPVPVKVGRSSRFVLSEIQQYVADLVANSPRKV